MDIKSIIDSIKKGAAKLKPTIRKNSRRVETLALVAAVGVLGLAVATDRVSISAEADDLTAQVVLMQTAKVSENAGTAGIYIDDELVALLPDTDMALEAMYAFEASYITPGAEVLEISTKESMVVSEAKVAPSEYEEIYFSSSDAAARYLENGTTEPLIYTVQKGDNLWNIARDNNINYYELLAMNPQLDPELQHVGDIVYLYERKPFATVTIKERVSAIESIPFDTVYESTDTLYSGQSAVKSAGVEGQKETITEYVRENGVEVSSEVISENVIAEPVAQHSYLGTATFQIQAGSGQLQSPVASIKVNSGFGTARTGHTHQGVDLGGHLGDPIYAADDGTVIMAKYSGTYGNVIKVDHGNGIVTVYAHLSEMLVSVGENVSKGQLIAKMGKTGNATGYLLHFEVQVNGVARDPMGYL